MRLYMVTGFLGAGKTTLLKCLIKLLCNEKIYLIINEFGKEGVDGSLLREMQVALAEINNGSIFCACRLDKFETEMERAIAERPDVIIVETSGLSDPTNVRKVLDQHKFSDIDYKGCMSIIDADRFEKVYTTATVVKKQLMVSSVILVNKTDLVTAEKLAKLKNMLNEINPAAKIFTSQYGNIDKNIMEHLTKDIPMEEVLNTIDITLQKALVNINENMTIKELFAFLDMIKFDCHRIKGFVNLQNVNYYVDGVGPNIKIEKYYGIVSNINKIVFLAGKGMPLRKSLKTACELYSNYVIDVEL